MIADYHHYKVSFFLYYVAKKVMYMIQTKTLFYGPDYFFAFCK